MSIKITYFVHGTTTDNEKKVSTGWSPGELSKLGVEQSKELSALVADRQFDAIFCSDLKRAVDSANFVFGDKYKIDQDKRLREINYGDLTEASENIVKPKLTQYIDKPFPNGESHKDVEKRMADFLNFLKENYAGKHIAVVAHKAPQLALDVLLKERTWPQAMAEDWRHKKAWQAGWKYMLED